MTDTQPNAARAYAVLDHIDAHPEQWFQRLWISRPHEQDCGTAACFAGRTSLLAGDVPDWTPWTTFEQRDVTEWVRSEQSAAALKVEFRAAELLGIDGADADNLFYSLNTREELGRMVAAIFGPRPTTV